jgi:hypothetical protein
MILKNAIIVFAFAILLIGCRKDDPIVDPDPCEGLTTGDLQLETKLVFNTEDFELSKDFQLDSNTHISFNTVQIYLSGLSLVNSSDTNLTPTSIVLIKPGTQSFDLGKVNAGAYTGIKLAMGIDSTTNHGDPTQYSEGHPLAFQIPNMHWSWNQGYIFAMLEGKWSPNPINENNPGNNWYFHIGLDGNFQQRNPIMINTTVNSCAKNIVKLKIDLSKLFNGVDISVNNESLSTNNFGLSNRVGSNLANAISSNE